MELHDGTHYRILEEIVLLERLVLQVVLALQVVLVQLELSARVLQVLLVLLVQSVLEPQVLLVQLVTLVLKELLEVRPIQVQQDLLDNEVLMGFLVEQVRLDLSEQDPLVQLVQEPQVLLVQPATLDPLVHLRL